MSSEVTNSHLEVLNSWKEIAQYLGRGVRTVQRWETTLGLPVRRPHGRGRSAVIAMRSDLEHWLRSCPTRNGFRNGNGFEQEKAVTVHDQATLDLRVQSKQLREDIRGARSELHNCILRLVKTLGKMSGSPGGLAEESDRLGGCALSSEGPARAG